MISRDAVKKEFEEISKKLSDPELISNPQELEKISARYGLLKEAMEKIECLEAIEKEISENKEILDTASRTEGEGELSSLAAEDLRNLLSQKETLEKELKDLLKDHNLPPVYLKKEKASDVIMEIRAGVGGEEAAIFAGDLFRMYSRFAQKQRWRIHILNSHLSDLGGYKEIIFEVSGKNVFFNIQQESGVHRVQRIPGTEKSGRIHTSTVTVAVLPKPESKSLQIDPKEIRVDVYRASGPGGQYVNRRESAVRITHFPSGLVATSQSSRTQLENKENALKILRAKILEKKEREEMGKRGELRKTQIGGGERAEKIRTYNFPQDRVTDHRLRKTWHHLGEIMEGNLEPIFNTFQKKERKV